MEIKNHPSYKELYNQLNDICKGAADLLHANAASIFLKEGNNVIMHAAHGYSESLIHKAAYKLGEGITGWIAQNHEFIANSKEEIINHPNHKGKYNEEIWVDGCDYCNSMIGIPLLIEGTLYGLIKVENKCRDDKFEPFTDEDKRRLKIFLDALSSVIQRNKIIWYGLGKYFVFVLMPFNCNFLNIYDYIKQSTENVDMFCKKLNDEPIIGKISNKIYESINEADIIISVMTDKNPNVFYETGYAHAKIKPTILLAENPDEIPFDLKDYSHIIYDANKLSELKDNLIKYLEYAKEKILRIQDYPDGIGSNVK
jgi:hypothetical protein